MICQRLSRLQLEPKLLLISCASVIFCLIGSGVVQSLSSVSWPIKKQTNTICLKHLCPVKYLLGKSTYFHFNTVGNQHPTVTQSYLDSSAVGFNVDDISHFNALFLKTLINTGIQLTEAREKIF